MMLSEMNQTFNFHDSFIDSIQFNKQQSEVILEIDFCNWMQRDYKDGEPETSKVQFTFSDVKAFEGPAGIFDEMTILETELRSGNKFVFKLSDLMSHNYCEIQIVAKKVNYIDLET